MSAIRRALWTVCAALPAAAGGLAAQQVIDLPARDVPLAADFAELYRVGATLEPSWQLYGASVEVAFDAAGNLYVFDRENYRIVKVSPTGTLVREIGERGDGPGELRSPVDFTVLRDGTVVVADMGARSFQVYGIDGEWDRSVPFGSDGAVMLGEVLADPRGGAVLSAGSRVVMMQVQGGRGAGMAMPTGRPIMRYGLAEGAAGEEVLRAWEPPADDEPRTASAAPGGGMAFRVGAGPRAFTPELFAGTLPDGGVAYSDSSAYQVRIAGPDGTLRRTLRRPIRPEPVTERIQEEERARRLAEMDAGGGPRISMQVAGRAGAAPQPVPQEQIQQMLRQQVEQLQFYPEIPVVTRLATGWAGKIWVERRGEELDGPGPVDVITPAGEYLGTIAADGLGVPDAFGPEGRVAYVERDELDVVNVVVRRLPAALR